MEIELQWIKDWVDWVNEVRSLDLADDSSLDISLSLLSHSLAFSSFLHFDELFSQLNKLDSEGLVDELLDE